MIQPLVRSDRERSTGDHRRESSCMAVCMGDSGQSDSSGEHAESDDRLGEEGKAQDKMAAWFSSPGHKEQLHWWSHTDK